LGDQVSGIFGVPSFGVSGDVGDFPETLLKLFRGEYWGTSSLALNGR
jgi:hypothetical protein